MGEYRAWHKIEKRMIYPDEIKDQSGDLWAIGFHGLPIAVDQDSFKNGNVTGWNIDHFLVSMRYTGQLDKNGKKIYEDDIVYAKDYWDESGLVYWNEKELQWWIRRTSNRGNEPLRTPFADGHFAFEVIGNIYEGSKRD